MATPASERVELATEAVVLALVAFAVSLGAYYAATDPTFFREVYVVEDGWVEWTTVLALVAALAVTLRRLFRLWRHRPPRFRAMLTLLSVLCLFGAGEEISWGQRIFDLETPAYFQEHNAQEEIGFHNLRVTIFGTPVKINRLIFGTGLALGFIFYLFVMTPVYRRREAFRTFVDGLAIPMPRNHHIVAYVVLVAFVELVVDSSKRGELTEFGGSFIFLLNIAFPYNAPRFRVIPR